MVLGCAGRSSWPRVVSNGTVYRVVWCVLCTRWKACPPCRAPVVYRTRRHSSPAGHTHRTKERSGHGPTHTEGTRTRPHSRHPRRSRDSTRTVFIVEVTTRPYMGHARTPGYPDRVSARWVHVYMPAYTGPFLIHAPQAWLDALHTSPQKQHTPSSPTGSASPSCAG